MARWLQRLLFAAGLVILGYCGAYSLNVHLQQRNGNRELDRLLTTRQVPVPEQSRTPAIPEGSLVGRVEIPDLHLSAVIFQGTTNSVLGRGVGHLDGSALPGWPGNVVLAAHRDSFFRSLKNIRRGDRVSVNTPYGSRTYEVDSTTIVDPTQVSVLQPTAEPTLTLITCYPFYFVGHAPKRFIVRAKDMQYEAQKAQSEPRIVAQNEPPLVITNPLSPQDSENLTYVFNAAAE